MATRKSNKSVRFGIVFQVKQQRYMSVMHFGTVGAPSFNQPLFDFANFWEGTLAPIWLACLPLDCHMKGWTIHPMVHGLFQPYSRAYGPAVYEGTTGTEACPPQSSMLLSFYSSSGPLATKTKTGKVFIGPPPETKQNGGILDQAFVSGELVMLGNTLTTGFVGSVSAVQWDLLLTRSKLTNVDCDVANVCLPRQTVFTQKRRALPIM